MTGDDKLPYRTLRTTFWISALVCVVFASRGQMAVSLGLATGAALGMFSLWTLMVAVPRLLTPDRTAPHLVLGALLFLKLPIYAVVINFAVTSPYVNAFAVFVGVAFVPCVLVLKVIGHQIARPADASEGEDSCRTKPAPSN